MSNKRMPGTAAATRICGAGNCFCGYKVCSNPTGRVTNPVSMIGSDEVCPLAKYKCKNIPKPTSRDKLLDYWQKCRVSKGDCALLCGECDYLETDSDGYISEDCYFKHCMDCPVNRTRESIEETEAEARCS